MEQTTTRETRDRIVVVRLTDSEYADLAERARRSDRSVSSYVRIHVFPLEARPST